MSATGSPSRALVALVTTSNGGVEEETPGWRRIYQGSNAVVLYNPTSHALAFHKDRQLDVPTESEEPIGEIEPSLGLCPFCHQTLPPAHDSTSQRGNSRVPNYFQLLSLANEVSSAPSTRPGSPSIDRQEGAYSHSSLASQSIAQGYFSTFFKEEYRLGMGANGSVYLCQHVLNGNPLGHFAVKKVAIGDSPEYLVKLLQEVRLLENLHHRNIINYHHAWLESFQFSSFGPPVPTLFILMQWAEGGSLDEFISHRLGKPLHSPAFVRTESTRSIDMDSGEEDLRSRSARIRAFRRKQRVSSNERNEQRKRRAERGRGHTTAIHLFGADEIKGIFGDIVSGLGFLHAKSILHLDLKPLNVLLTWDDGTLIPRGMLSDFGTSLDTLAPSSSSHVRSGNTGTLEYCAPESIFRDPSSGELQPIDSRSDMWSLGMILHKMVFFTLPFSHVEDSDIEGLEREIMNYPGFKTTPDINASIKRRSLPRAITVLLESLLNVSPFLRPTCEQVINAINEGKLDPLLRERQADDQMVSIVRKPPSPASTDTHMSWVNATASANTINGGNIEEVDTKEEVLNEVTPLLGAPETPSIVERGAMESLIGPLPAAAYSQADFVRVFKATLVVVKVLTLFQSCRGSLHIPSITSLITVLILALADTFFDGLISTVYLTIAHLALLSQSHLICIPS